MTTSDAASVLIVEDNELNLKLFSDLLTARGYEVHTTKEGRGAAEMIRKIMPGLVLMDVQLHGISGLDIIKQIKADKYIGSIPVVAVTAFAMKDDKERILASGCDGYMSKPISIEPFFEMVAKYVEK